MFKWWTVVKKPSDRPKGITARDQLIAARIATARKDAGLSQIALAEKTGVTFQQIQKYERADNRIAASRLFAVAQATDKPISYFFED